MARSSFGVLPCESIVDRQCKGNMDDNQDCSLVRSRFVYNLNTAQQSPKISNTTITPNLYHKPPLTAREKEALHKPAP